MTTILVLNAFSSLVATIGIGGWLVRKNWHVRNKALLSPIYVTARTTRPNRGR